MRSLPNEIAEALTAWSGSPIADAQAVGGGSICARAKVEFRESSPAFVKWLPHSNGPVLAAEEAGLLHLAETPGVRVPKILIRGEAAQWNFLALEYLPPARPSRDDAREFGTMLAALHQRTATMPGFDTDNFIGFTPQQNTPRKEMSWGNFYLGYRLTPQLRRAVKAGLLSKTDEGLLSNLEESLVAALNEPGEPQVLLHGDLWGGNIHWSSQGPTLIDPAVYYGSREADIAWLLELGSPPPDAMREYENLAPLKPGFATRRTILNLYHILNHANMFGGGYVQEAKGMIRALAHAL